MEARSVGRWRHAPPIGTPALLLVRWPAAGGGGGARAAPRKQTKAMKLAAALLLAHYGVFCGAAKPPAKPNVLTLLYVLA